MQAITVTHKMHESKDDIVSVPIVYNVIVNGSRTEYECKVALDDSKMPEWLTLKAFTIPVVEKSAYPGGAGITAVLYSEIKGHQNIDTALFMTDVYEQINTTEIWKASHGS